MKKRNRILLLLASAAALAASCDAIAPLTAPPLTSGRANFSIVAALGTGVTAGFQSGGLVTRHQINSFAVLFAQQAAARPLEAPLVDGDGIPPLLELKHLYPPPVVIGPVSSTPGNSIHSGLPTAFHNLGVPTARIKDILDTTQYTLPTRDVFFDVVQRGRGSLAMQIGTQINPPPTFLLYEFGMSELLQPALNGTAVGAMTVVSFADSFGRTLDTLAALLPGAKMAVLNVPDVTSLPFFTTISSRQLDRFGQPVLDANGRPRFLIGPNNVSLTANDLVLLSAQPSIAAGNGYPLGTFVYLSPTDSVPGSGSGLTDSQVLSNSDALTLQDRARRFNSIIDTTSRSTAKPRDFAIVDFDGLLRRARSPGIEIRGVTYTTRFLTGGLFGLDGVYPNDIAHALLCNQTIAAVNARFGSNIQPLDPLRIATLGSRAGPARKE